MTLVATHLYSWVPGAVNRRTEPEAIFSSSQSSQCNSGIGSPSAEHVIASPSDLSHLLTGQLNLRLVGRYFTRRIGKLQVRRGQLLSIFGSVISLLIKEN